jgi:predicted alpha-1,6-mannanase (GH76 family)
MARYRAFFIGSGERIVARLDLTAVDDVAAKKQARQLVENSAVELWDHDRKVARFEPPASRKLTLDDD